jgi:hypothetical protein
VACKKGETYVGVKERPLSNSYFYVIVNKIRNDSQNIGRNVS